ncbi:acyltransferase [Candidatus Stoquefichus sp. SB1]|uniref:acyltransferase n=1 Tax=Candidatus Stoquefichus sp. SB1 TaxID=1658109 RepID=UPI00067E7F81|nr:acyltransferase [Candidatus Stoquefichus sp. SB1]
MNSFYSVEELKELGLKSFGKNVLISKKASIYNSKEIEIGNNVRIDDFCILSGKIKLANNIHIAAYSSLFAGNVGIELESFSCISSRCVIYSISDDYSGNYLTNPTVPNCYRNVIEEPVLLKKHVLIGTGSTVLPGVTIGEGTSIGAMTLVNKSLDSWGIYIGIPAKKIKDRSQKLLKLEEKINY